MKIREGKILKILKRREEIRDLKRGKGVEKKWKWTTLIEPRRIKGDDWTNKNADKDKWTRFHPT